MSTEGAVVVSVNDLNVGYGKVSIVRDASLQIKRGELAAIVGPNGSGKSTLLKGIIGVLRPSSGDVRIWPSENGAERMITGRPPEDTVRLGMGYVPQLANVFPSLQVGENLILGLQTRNKAERIRRLDEVYTLFPDLRGKAKNAARTLSGGQRMMLALGRALMSDPIAILVDEPCAGLSPRYRDAVWDQLGRMREAGVGLLVVEQNTRAALEVADYGYVLVAGQIRQEGDAKSLLSDTELIELYIGKVATAGK